MDDDFAAFLSEVDNIEAGDGGAEGVAEGSAQTKRSSPLRESGKAGADGKDAKRARTNGEIGKAERAELAASLRKAAFKGDAKGVDKLLGELSTVDRLLIVDDLDSEDGLAAAHLAAIEGHIGVVKSLIKWRADVDVASSPGGDTPLMWAAYLGAIDICRELLKAGADAALKNKRLKTAGDQARAEGRRKICELLEKHWLDVQKGAKRKAAAAPDAAAARRAANLKMVEAAIREQKEREEEEAFWAKVKARREGREREEEANGTSADNASSEPDRKKMSPDAYGAAEVAAAALSALPAKVRPHYRILGAEPDATDDDVRKLYRQLALKHHPDKNPGDEAGAKERFTKIAEAYEAVCEYLAGQEAPRGICIAPPSF